jgi:hypothetical protein
MIPIPTLFWKRLTRYGTWVSCIHWRYGTCDNCDRVIIVSDERRPQLSTDRTSFHQPYSQRFSVSGLSDGALLNAFVGIAFFMKKAEVDPHRETAGAAC